MAILKVTRLQIAALEFQTNLVYDAFDRAVQTREYQDAAWLPKLYEGLGRSLSVATDGAAFMDWNRGTQRADLMDRYLLQYALGNIPAVTLQRAVEQERISGRFPELRPTSVTEVDVSVALDNKRIPYRRLQTMAINLGDAGHFDGVVRLVSQVRETYQKPSI